MLANRLSKEQLDAKARDFKRTTNEAALGAFISFVCFCVAAGDYFINRFGQSDSLPSSRSVVLAITSGALAVAMLVTTWRAGTDFEKAINTFEADPEQRVSDGEAPATPNSAEQE